MAVKTYKEFVQEMNCTGAAIAGTDPSDNRATLAPLLTSKPLKRKKQNDAGNSRRA